MKIGLLPLYIQLYDETSPDLRSRLEAFYEKIATEFSLRGILVEKTVFCRKKPEFEQAISSFEEAEVDALVTLHMAYSPSLESIDALTGTSLPIIILDTTETLEFTPEQDPGEIMYNHGIHGVMDLCSMLKRYDKAYAIAAGHYLESDCIDRACGYVRAAKAAASLQKARVGLVGGAFDGMGDFAVALEELKERFHITVEHIAPEVLEEYNRRLTQDILSAELAENETRFGFAPEIIPEEYIQSVRSGLALRACIEAKDYSAFSVNFLKVGEKCGLPSMPFLECCKAMERGIGYAGEGDALTAAFTGALLSAYPEAGFIEIFCPDWKNNMLFLSHMGEVNYRLADSKPFICRAGTNFTQGSNPYIGYARMKGGKGVYVNVSRGKEDYRLFLAPAEMLSFNKDHFTYSIRGWMRPEHLTTAEFLEAHSRHGATHHSIFVYDATVEELSFFGQLLSMETIIVKKRYLARTIRKGD